MKRPDLDEEIQSYVELLVAEKMKAGMTREEATRAARLEVGGTSHIAEEVREARRGAVVDATLRDLRFGWRMLRRSPGFAAVAILTIGLGIGANTAIFSVVNGVVRKPLAYPQPDRLMFLTSQFPTMHYDKFWVSPPEYMEYREHTRAFSGMAAYTTGALNVSERSSPEQVNTAFVTTNMFSVLGVSPERGRVFTEAEGLPNADPVVVIGDELWRRAFGADPSIVGKQIQIQGVDQTVVGIMPPGFDLHDSKSQIWIPLTLDPANRSNRGNHFLRLVGRLAPGVTPQQAQSELKLFLTQWGSWVGATTGAASVHVPNDSTHPFVMMPLRDEVVGNVAKALWVLQGAVALVLLIACANVANLLLARAESRHQEFAVRTALGASRTRVLRQFMTEGIVLSTAGAVLGLIIAYWGLKAILLADPGNIPRIEDIGLDPWVLGFTVLVAIATGLVFGLAPLLHMGGRSVTLATREGGARTTSTAGRNRVRRALVTGEIALAVTLVIGAGLLIRSFANLTSVDPGFDSRDRVTFGLVLPQASYPDAEQRLRFFRDLHDRIEAIPGVREASMMQGLPPYRRVNANDTQFEGYTYVPGSGGPIPNVDYFQVIAEGYFQTMGIPIVEGRAFTKTDAVGAPVVIINQALAKKFYPNQNPIGRRINPYLTQDTTWFTIVGIARDVKQGGLDVPAGTELYLDYAQLPRVAGFAPGQMNVVLRSSRPLAALSPALRSAVRTMDPELPIVQMRTMDDVVGASVTRQRFLSLLLGVFAAVALVLAAIGTYGVLAYMVTERNQEIGIRMALGASHGRVVGMVMRSGLAIAAVGILVGVVGAFALSRVTRSLLYDVSPVDPLTYGVVAIVIALVAAGACILPSRRATRVDPISALRS
ncbi:MAG TPA: ABC transporter permease [Gemmatimonadaceae bacterium]|nr:ABC transporter permease [Gemmatimonadaceae bacterium]